MHGGSFLLKMSNPSTDDLSLEDKVSYVRPEWGPPGRDDAFYKPDDNKDKDEVENVTPTPDNTSEGASSFSLPTETVDFSCLLDLSNGNRFCLVRMLKHNGRVQTTCVCGNLAEKALGNMTALAQPGYYQEYIDSKGNNTSVGLANKRWFTVDEYL